MSEISAKGSECSNLVYRGCSGHIHILYTIMNWLYNNKEVIELPEDCAGFVYQITNTTTGRKYIGKKLLLKVKSLMHTGKSIPIISPEHRSNPLFIA